MKLIISETLVKSLAFDTRSTELTVYRALMERLDSLKPAKQTKPVRRQFRLNGSSTSILIKYTQDSITIIPAANKKTMALDYTKFLSELELAYGEQADFISHLQQRLLTI